MADFQDVVNSLAVNNTEEKQRDSNLNKNVAFLRDSNKLVFQEFIASDSSNKAAAVEVEKEKNAKDSKNQSILQKIAGGITGLKGLTEKGMDKVKGSSFFKMLKGTLLAGAFFAMAAFFQSDLWPKLVNIFTKVLLPLLITIYNFFADKFSKFFTELGDFLEDPTWSGFANLIGDNKIALLALAALLIPGTLLKGLSLGISALVFGLNDAGKALDAEGKRTGKRFSKTRGFFGKAAKMIMAPILLLKGIFIFIGAKLAIIGTALTTFTGIALAPLLLIVAAFVAVGYALFETFKAFTKRFEETGSIGESIKAGISTFLGTLIALPATLFGKIVGFIAGLLGFDSFKEKIDKIDFAGETIKAIESGINYVIDFFKKLPEQIGAFFTKYIGPDAQWAKDVQQSVVDFFAPIVNFDFSALLGDLLAKAGDIGKRVASFFGFGDDKKEDVKASAKKSTADVLVSFEKERQVLQDRINQLERMNSSSSKREQNFREKQLDQMNKSAIAKSIGGDASAPTVINAPNVKTSTNNSNTTVSSTQYVGQTDPIINAAAFSGI